MFWRRGGHDGQAATWGWSMASDTVTCQVEGAWQTPIYKGAAQLVSRDVPAATAATALST